MRRVVAPWLPMEDPANEARKIVRAGMGEIIESFSDEVWDDWYAEAGPVIWGDKWGPALPMVDVVVGKHVTFVSAQVDVQCQILEAQAQAMAERFRIAGATYAIPQHWLFGYVDPV